MTFTGYPFENQDTTETQYQRIMRQYQESGVCALPGDPDMAVVSAGGLIVRLNAGLVHHAGILGDNDGNTTDGEADLNLGPASPGVRVDRVVARFDSGTNDVYPYRIPGTSGSTTAPALVRAGTIWDEPLARITIQGGAAGLAAGAIVDERRFTGQRVKHWTTAERPTTGRYVTGWNLDTGRLEFRDHTGAWRYLIDNLDLDRVGEGEAAPPMRAGWASLGAAYGPITYWRRVGVVHLAGVAVPNLGAAARSVIMDLPVGFRPQYVRRFSVPLGGSAGAVVTVEVQPGGQVLLDTPVPAGSNVSLAGVSFVAAA